MARQLELAENAGNARRMDAVIRECRAVTELDPNYA